MRKTGRRDFRHLAGQKFHKWEALYLLSKSGTNHGTRYWCRCECGKEQAIKAVNLVDGKTKSCGKYPCRSNSYHRNNTSQISGVLYCYLTRQAEIRGLSFHLEREYLWDLYEFQHRKCALTGQDLILTRSRIKGNASLDRIDSTKGYERGNVWWVTKHVNLMKRDFTVKEFIHTCKLIVNGLRSKRTTIASNQTVLNFD